MDLHPHQNLIKDNESVTYEALNKTLLENNAGEELVKIVQDIFTQINTNPDKVIDSKEWNNFVSIFSQADKNSDGVISDEEIEQNRDNIYIKKFGADINKFISLVKQTVSKSDKAPDYHEVISEDDSDTEVTLYADKGISMEVKSKSKSEAEAAYKTSVSVDVGEKKNKAALDTQKSKNIKVDEKEKKNKLQKASVEIGLDEKDDFGASANFVQDNSTLQDGKISSVTHREQNVSTEGAQIITQAATIDEDNTAVSHDTQIETSFKELDITASHSKDITQKDSTISNSQQAYVKTDKVGAKISRHKKNGDNNHQYSAGVEFNTENGTAQSSFKNTKTGTQGSTTHQVMINGDTKEANKAKVQYEIGKENSDKSKNNLAFTANYQDDTPEFSVQKTSVKKVKESEPPQKEAKSDEGDASKTPETKKDGSKKEAEATETLTTGAGIKGHLISAKRAKTRKDSKGKTTSKTTQTSFDTKTGVAELSLKNEKQDGFSLSTDTNDLSGTIGYTHTGNNDDKTSVKVNRDSEHQLSGNFEHTKTTKKGSKRTIKASRGAKGNADLSYTTTKTTKSKTKSKTRTYNSGTEYGEDYKTSANVGTSYKTVTQNSKGTQTVSTGELSGSVDTDGNYSGNYSVRKDVLSEDGELLVSNGIETFASNNNRSAVYENTVVTKKGKLVHTEVSLQNDIIEDEKEHLGFKLKGTITKAHNIATKAITENDNTALPPPPRAFQAI